MANPEQTFVLDNLGDGLNDGDHWTGVPDTQVVECYNIDWYRQRFPKKRAGCTAWDLTPWSGVTGVISSLYRHLPTGEGTAELWAVTDTPAMGRYEPVGGWSTVTISDTLTQPAAANFASFNGKLFHGYKTGTTNRLHVWDGTSLRRVGLATPAAATVADQGSGSYATTLRYYKVQYLEVVSSVVTRRSELSPVVSFTPSGSGVSARVTKPTAITEGETHWRVWGSADGANYFLLSANILVATTTYDDATAPSAYTGTVAPVAGEGTPPPNARYLTVHNQRLVLARPWNDTAGSRVYWTPVLHTTDEGDDERIPSANYLDIAPGAYGDIKALATFAGDVLVWKWGALYRLVDTGNVSAPYQVVELSTSIGCVQQRMVMQAEDENGDPCVYWMSPRGPYRLGPQGLQYLGRDIEGTLATFNPVATRPGHGMFYPAKKQVWWWLATTSSLDPDALVVFDITKGVSMGGLVRHGWSRHNGTIAMARCSVLWDQAKASPYSLKLKPFKGHTTGTAIWLCDTGTDDAGTDFQAYVLTKPYALAGLMRNFGITEAQLLAKAATGVTITLDIIQDFSLDTRRTTCSLVASVAEARVCRKLEDTWATGAQVVQFQLGDAAALDNGWELDALVVRWRDEELR